MFYEVFIPSSGGDDFDVTITVEADNWMTALKSGLARTGQGEDAIRNVMCDIKDDNSIHVTDATTRRVFVLKELGEKAPDTSGEMPVAREEDLATIKMQAPDYDALAKQRDAQQQQPGRGVQPTPIVRDSAELAAAEPVVPPEFGREHTEPQFQQSSEPQIQHNTEPQFQPQPAPAAQPAQPKVVVQPQPEPAQPKVIVQPQAAPEPKVVVQPQQPAQPVQQPQSAPPVQQQPQQPAQPNVIVASESQGLSAEQSWTSEDAARLRIGSSTFEALRREEPEPHVVREKRIPTGEREAIGIGRTEEKVSDNILEEVFLEINRIHEGDMTMEQVVNYVMDLAMDKVRAEAGSIMFADVNGKELYFATARGPKAHDVMNFRVPMGKGIVGFCAREGVSLAISDAENDPRFYKAISDALGYPTKSLCCAPIQYEGRVYGAIELLNKTNQHFSSTEANVLTYIGRQLAQFVHDLIMAREKI